eukprot:gene8995-biopygen12177
MGEAAADADLQSNAPRPVPAEQRAETSACRATRRDQCVQSSAPRPVPAQQRAETSACRAARRDQCLQIVPAGRAHQLYRLGEPTNCAGWASPPIVPQGWVRSPT